MAYFLAAAAASGVFIAASWRGRTDLALAPVQGRPRPLIDPVWDDVEANIYAPEARADVGVAMRVALKRLSPIMTNQFVQADVAALPGLRVRMRGAPLTDLLEEMLAAAIHAAPASRLLLTAAAHGSRIDVGIADDMPGADPTVRLERVRGLTARVARRGGTLEVNVRPAEGTTLTLRLAAAADA
ncbi:hypothetical protein [Rhodopila sp.]|uniref:hypothetical protein n=1 Tax=Rhodopila sp. TaxID=2480087 RepID=UPI003D0F7BD1